MPKIDRKLLPRILLVDDEPAILEGLEIQLRRKYQVISATSGQLGLDELSLSNDFSVVVSDMRMPSMDGATFLSHCREVSPDTVRILLTGYSDQESAISAINDGQIYRFLTKPCPASQFLRTIDEATKQHNLITAEHELLEKTLHGCVKTLMDVLALTNAVGFGRATRLHKIVKELCDELNIKNRWFIEVAAMVSQLGAITLPEQLAEKLYYSEKLNHEEQQQVDALPAVVNSLLENIPRLEPVLDLLADLGKKSQLKDPKCPANLIKIAMDYDILESRGQTAQECLDILQNRMPIYPAIVIQALIKIKGDNSLRKNIQEIPIKEIHEGMVFAADVFTSSGILLIPRGFSVTSGLISKTQQFRKDYVQEPVLIINKEGQ
ncbi:MAG: response regulator [Methylococcales bacterium]|nr:response regulator [Methylococcales bacterium]MBT7408674.1 response regulator [Methylococcales bacterium]